MNPKLFAVALSGVLYDGPYCTGMDSYIYKKGEVEKRRNLNLFLILFGIRIHRYSYVRV
jgi:hypothetical protein